MWIQHLLKCLIFMLIGLNVLSLPSIDAIDGNWILVEEDYTSYSQSLSGYQYWSFNATHGPHDRWVINFSISSLSINPATIFICNETAFESWHQTMNLRQYQFLQRVNKSLHAQIDLTYLSRWYFVVNNTGPFTFYFNLRIAHYHGTTEFPETSPINIASNFGNLLLLIIFLGVIIFIVIPCICNCGCLNRLKGKSKTRHCESEEIHHHHHTFVIVSAEALSNLEFLDEDDE